MTLKFLRFIDENQKQPKKIIFFFVAHKNIGKLKYQISTVQTARAWQMLHFGMQLGQ